MSNAHPGNGPREPVVTLNAETLVKRPRPANPRGPCGEVATKSPSSAPDSDYVTVQVAADHFGFPTWRVYRAIKRDLLKSYRFANGRILVRLSDIHALLEASAQDGAR